jgi:hypothetical protein
VSETLTPRTDAEERSADAFCGDSDVVSAGFARQLETALTAAQAENAAMRECLRKIAALDPVPRYVAFYLLALQSKMEKKGVTL